MTDEFGNVIMDVGTTLPVDNSNDVWGTLKTIAGDITNVAIARSQPNPFPTTFGSFPQSQAKPGQGVLPVATPPIPGNAFISTLAGGFGLSATMFIVIAIVVFMLLRR